MHDRDLCKIFINIDPHNSIYIGTKKWLEFIILRCFYFFIITCSVLCIIYMFFLDPLSQYVYYAYLDLNCHKQSLVLADKNLLFHFEVPLIQKAKRYHALS